MRAMTSAAIDLDVMPPSELADELMPEVADAAVGGADQAVVDRAASWASSAVAPHAESWERERRFAAEAFASAGDERLCGLLVPVADGGSGLSQVGLARVLEEVAAADFAIAFVLVCHNNLAGAVSRRAPAEMRERALGPLVSGEQLGAFLLTEPGVGSDAAKITTAARRDGDEWVIDGRKAWVSNGTAADVMSVYAQADPAAGHRGIMTFLVDGSSDGIERTDGYELIGAHGIGTNEVSFNECRVSDADVMVPLGEGFVAAMEGIDIARVLVAAMCCGMMRTGLATAIDYVRKRQAFGGRIADLQGVRFKLADVATDLEAARLLAYRAALAVAEGRPAAVHAAHAKKFATRVAERGLADCMQVMGAVGGRRDHPLPRHLAASRLTHYVDGATEIQDVVISRSLLD